MSDLNWEEADDFEPPALAVPSVSTDRWQGEDEETDVKDNWDEEDEEEQTNTADNGEVGTAVVQSKKKRSLKEIIAEKEEKKRKELEERKRREEEESDKPPLSGAELAAEKLRQQKLQEESDLILAAEAFGVAPPNLSGVINSMEPSSKEDFDKFEEVLREKITKFEKSPHYVPFLENLYRQLAIDLDHEDIKRLGSTLTALSNEKAKQQKGTKGKKKKQKATINVGKDADDVLVADQVYDDYDDFI